MNAARGIAAQAAPALLEPHQNPKPWWQSKTNWGVLAATIAGLGAAFGMDVDEAALTDFLLAGASLAGGAYALYGRYKADRPIRFRRTEKN